MEGAEPVGREQRSPLSLPSAAALSLGAGTLGLLTGGLGRLLHAHVPSVRTSASILLWNVLVLGLLAVVLRRREHATLTTEIRHLWRNKVEASVDSSARTPVAIAGLAICGVLFVVIPRFIGTSATSGNSYGRVHHASLLVTVVELGVRYPVTVFAEETLFRGFIQSRITYAPPVTSGLLFALYHLPQAMTIPSLIPLGIALGIVRWWTGSLRLGAAIHYLSNAAFFLGTYW